MYALGEHTVRTSIEPCTQFEDEIHCISVNGKKQNRFNDRVGAVIFHTLALAHT